MTWIASAAELQARVNVLALLNMTRNTAAQNFNRLNMQQRRFGKVRVFFVSLAARNQSFSIMVNTKRLI